MLGRGGFASEQVNVFSLLVVELPPLTLHRTELSQLN